MFIYGGCFSTQGHQGHSKHKGELKEKDFRKLMQGREMFRCQNWNKLEIINYKKFVLFWYLS